MYCDFSILWCFYSLTYYFMLSILSNYLSIYLSISIYHLSFITHLSSSSTINFSSILYSSCDIWKFIFHDLSLQFIDNAIYFYFFSCYFSTKILTQLESLYLQWRLQSELFHFLPIPSSRIPSFFILLFYLHIFLFIYFTYTYK